MRRFFNTTGPCNPREHYMLPSEARLPTLLNLVEQNQYFVLHAARQTGKTTAMLAFAERLRGMGYAAIWVTLEASQGVTEIAEAEPIWLRAIEKGGRALTPEWRPSNPVPVIQSEPGSRLGTYLTAWAESIQHPIVLLLDEADVVSGPALVSLLRQLRAGFTTRAVGNFPTSIALIGMRDLRDYLTTAKDGTPVNPGSPFNIKSESLTLRSFTAPEVRSLYQQHADATGQQFLLSAIARAWYWTQGQPFLVNALARKIVMEIATEGQPIDEGMVDKAKELLILSRTTHLDSLGERLKEPRVARVVEPVLLGDKLVPYDSDDFVYCLDLGLLRKDSEGTQPANPLYREILVRQLTLLRQENLPLRPWWPWRTATGGLNMPALMDAFLEWWRENAAIIEEEATTGYLESVPHLTFMAFLQRVANGGGRITREYAAGRGAVDLLIEYANERHVIELKRVPPRHVSLETVKRKGLLQVADYLDTVGEKEGWLLIFDQRPGRSWEERLWAEETLVGGKRVYVRGG